MAIAIPAQRDRPLLVFSVNMEDAPSSLFAGMRDRGLTHFSWNFYLEFWFRQFSMIFDERAQRDALRETSISML
jgi:hypothetical protein